MPVRGSPRWFRRSRRPDLTRDLAFGLVAVAFLLWLTFFAAGPGSVEVATLAAAVAALIWLATVDPSRLVDASGRPQALLFGLAAMGMVLLVTAAALLSSATTFLTLVVGVAGLITGTTRAVRHGIGRQPTEE